MKKLVKIIGRRKYEEMLRKHEDLVMLTISKKALIGSHVQFLKERYELFEIHQDKDRFIREVMDSISYMEKNDKSIPFELTSID